MRFYLIYLSALVLVISCNYNTATENTNRDLQVDFLLHSTGHKTDDTFVCFCLYPGFCGACSDSVTALILENSIPENIPQYCILSKDDSIWAKEHNLINRNLIFVDRFERDRHGLQSAKDKFYIIRNGKVIYSSELDQHLVSVVRTKIDSLFSKTTKF
jgi:hypothetical protein